MKKRNIAVVVGVAGTVLALASCGVEGPSGSGGDLTVASTSNNQAPLEAVVNAYEEETGKDVNVTFADTTQYQSTLRTQLSSGTAPDVFTVWAGGGNPGAIEVLQGAGYLADLSDRPWVADVDPGTAETLQIDGKTYGLPSKLDAVGAVYNAASMEEAGLEAPTSFSDLLSFCKGASEAGKVAFALGIQTDWVTQLIPYALVASTLYADDPDFDEHLADGSATFEGSGWEEALEKYQQMEEAGCFNADPLGTDVNASYDLVTSGQAIAVVQVLASYPQIASVAPDGTEFGFFPLPGDDRGETALPRGIGVSFAVNVDAVHGDAAVDFVDWLATPEATSAWFEAAPGLPAIPNEAIELDPVMQTASDLIANGSTAPMPDQGWPSAKPQSELFIGVQQLFSGQATPQDVTVAMDEAYAASE